MRWLTILAVVLLAAMGWEALQLSRIEKWNRSIDTGASSLDPSLPERVRFAAAFHLAEQRQVESALNAYRELSYSRDAALRRAAKFNCANLYLEEALRERTAGSQNATLALMELAKQSYRDLLREDPGNWDARYNLERALRLAPDAGVDAPDLPPPPDSRHIPSITPGITLGLP